MADEDKYPMKFSNDPPTWFDKSDGHSNKAIYTCENCGAKHKGFEPSECLHCEGTDLRWSYSYGARRFA